MPYEMELKLHRRFNSKLLYYSFKLRRSIVEVCFLVQTDNKWAILIVTNDELCSSAYCWTTVLLLTTTHSFNFRFRIIQHLLIIIAIDGDLFGLTLHNPTNMWELRRTSAAVCLRSPVLPRTRNCKYVGRYWSDDRVTMGKSESFQIRLIQEENVLLNNQRLFQVKRFRDKCLENISILGS